MDIVVTVPQQLWLAWLAEGDLPGEPPTGHGYHFWIAPFALPNTQPGERVYVFAFGRVRGYAPLVAMEPQCSLNPAKACLLRRDGAVAMTIPLPVPPRKGPRGFRSWRYRWWGYREERPYPDWRTDGVPDLAALAGVTP